MDTTAKKLFTPELVRGAVRDAFKRLSPRYQLKNPVMFVVWIGSAHWRTWLGTPFTK